MEQRIYRLLFENSLQGMVLHQDEHFVLVNQSFADFIGYSIDELMGFSMSRILRLVHPEDRKSVLAYHKALLDGGRLPKAQVFRFRRRNGETGWWTVALSMVSYQGRPAILGVYEDITERILAEEALTRRRDLLSATLDVLPVGVCLTDEDGYYRLMNDAYCAIYEYDRTEMLGKHYSVIMPPDQIELANAHYARLLTGDTGIPIERKRQRKDGAIVYIEAANALVMGEGEQKMVITTVRDITERKRSEEITQMRLRLLEYAAEHTLQELMQKALDELGELTGSPIGFYHFIGEDQKELSLQAWSTRTLAEFCQAEAGERHHPIERAGVWADSLRQKQTVIHNDYAALPQRKGLPEGHAVVLRELTTPTIRDGKVVAILGLGNKPADYNAQDAELVAFTADVIWTIVEQKRTEDHIRELNIQLEHLAMADDLTDLPNRRAFFAQGEQETQRAKRYQTPFSVLMLDVDRFKDINDTYGHAAGDFVLQQVAHLLSANIRQVDMVARMGGEEFSVLLPGTRAEDAAIMAERIRIAVEQGTCEVQGHTVGVTVSIGVGAFGPLANDLEAVLKQADDCLYHAKEAGRNRVMACGLSDPPGLNRHR